MEINNREQFLHTQNKTKRVNKTLSYTSEIFKPVSMESNCIQGRKFM